MIPQSNRTAEEAEEEEEINRLIAELFDPNRKIEVTPELLARRRRILDEIIAMGGVGDFAGYDAGEAAERAALEEEEKRWGH